MLKPKSKRTGENILSKRGESAKGIIALIKGGTVFR